jgi:hypothetical protein
MSKNLHSTAAPRIQFEVPPEWAFKEQVTILRDPENQVSANLIASSEPASPDTDSEGYAKQIAEQLQRECPAFIELEFERMDAFGETDGWLRRFEWEPERDLRITQLQVYCVNRGRAYTATATAESEHFDRYRAELLEVLYSLTIKPCDEKAAAVAVAAVATTRAEPGAARGASPA